MKKLTLIISALLSAGAHADKPDTIGGSPKADFHANELTIPCVLVAGLDDSTEGLFYDIKLKRRGSSFNYELTAAQAEDTEMCQAIADFAELEDEDYVDDDEEDDSTDDDSTDDDSTDDDSTDDDSTDDDSSDDDSTADDSTDDDATNDDTVDDSTP